MNRLIVPGMRVKAWKGGIRMGRVLFPSQTQKVDGIPHIGGEPYAANWKDELPVKFDDNGEIAFVMKVLMDRA